jgi:hypothetical protein
MLKMVKTEQRASERDANENVRVCDIAGTSERLGARVIRVITTQLHYLINPGGRGSRQSSQAVIVP